MAKSKLKIKYIEPHQNGYRYHRKLPKDVFRHFGRKAWIKTFKAGTPDDVVVLEAMTLARKHDNLILMARGDIKAVYIQESESEARKMLADDEQDAYETLAFGLSLGLDSRDPFVNTLLNRGTYRPPGLSLSEAAKQDTEKYGQGRDARPFDYAIGLFVGHVGDLGCR